MTMSRILFRVDATAKIGAGHLMRSVALAQHFKAEGWEVCFLTAQPWKKIQDYLKAQNFRVVSLALSDEALGGEKDLQCFLQELKQGYAWVVLDNYHFRLDYQKAIRNTGARLLIIDDFAGQEFCCDLLLNHGLNASRQDYTSLDSRKLLGTKYALIRKELKVPCVKKEKGKRNLLVTLGGGHDGGMVQKVMEAIQLLGMPEIQVKVLGGFSNNDLGKLKKMLCSQKMEICEPSFDLSELYEWADFAVCAGGGTAWELIHYGVVGMVGILADNQKGVAESLREAGIFTSVGWYRDVSREEVASLLRDTIHNETMLEEMRRRAVRLVDGEGPMRIYEAMQEVECEIHQNR